jgi:hypothetical protein
MSVRTELGCVSGAVIGEARMGGIGLPVEFEDGDGIGSLNIGAVPSGTSDRCAGAIIIVGAISSCSILNKIFKFCEESGVDS